jgi:hypothetical protein
MADNLHPLAPHHLPGFLAAADGTDSLMVVMGVFLALAVFGAGIFYLHLHSIPERRMHGAGKAQFEIVAVLSLIALLTHNNLFWIAALILAMIDLPNVSGPLKSISESLDRMARDRAASPDLSDGTDLTPQEAVEIPKMPVESDEKGAAANA